MILSRLSAFRQNIWPIFLRASILISSSDWDVPWLKSTSLPLAQYPKKHQFSKTVPNCSKNDSPQCWVMLLKHRSSYQEWFDWNTSCLKPWKVHPPIRHHSCQSRRPKVGILSILAKVPQIFNMDLNYANSWKLIYQTFDDFHLSCALRYHERVSWWHKMAIKAINWAGRRDLFPAFPQFCSPSKVIADC